jgi:DNA-binding NarL/FixJ family response regulator
VRCSFWLGFCLLQEGEPARGNGWLARGRRLLDEAGLDCVERGYLLLPQALEISWGGRPTASRPIFADALAIGERFQEPDLIAMARTGLGGACIHAGEARKGVAMLDETMASVLAGEVSPLVSGLMYCAVLAFCQESFDTRRAQEWMRAFNHWYEVQPELVLYRGDCRVYRAEFMQLRGAWPDAMEEVRLACRDLDLPSSNSWAGGAFYQLGEVHRLRGEFAAAEEAYRQASQWGRPPQPGLALLRLAQGRAEAALSAIGLALTEAADDVARARFLPAQVEVSLAAGQIETARAAAHELEHTAGMLDVPLLHALAARAEGAVALADGEEAAALGHLRKAMSIWYALEAPYEAARTRTLIAAACSALGDDDGAALELDAAIQVFRRLGATPDLEHYAGEPANGATGSGPAGLTVREIEVLKLVAAGKTNHAIAQELFLSDHTVRRHLQNVFAKLGVSSRAAATAFALQHKLI